MPHSHSVLHSSITLSQASNVFCYNGPGLVKVQPGSYTLPGLKAALWHAVLASGVVARDALPDGLSASLSLERLSLCVCSSEPLPDRSRWSFTSMCQWRHHSPAPTPLPCPHATPLPLRHSPAPHDPTPLPCPHATPLPLSNSPAPTPLRCPYANALPLRRYAWHFTPTRFYRWQVTLSISDSPSTSPSWLRAGRQSQASTPRKPLPPPLPLPYTGTPNLASRATRQTASPSVWCAAGVVTLWL
jgi:hypothetical protein